MSKPIVLSHKQWDKLLNRLQNDYSPSVIMIRQKRKTKLGFTEREHRWWEERKGYQSHMCLDFFDDKLKTMFCLKYSEYIQGE